MKVRVEHQRFEHRQLEVSPAGITASVKLFLDGEEVPKAGKIRPIYEVTDDAGEPVRVELKISLLDPIPTVVIGEEKVKLTDPLQWYQWIWLGAPAALLFVGGALGAGIGIATAYLNVTTFRKHETAAMRYGLTGAFTLGAVMLWLFIGIALHLIIG